MSTSRGSRRLCTTLRWGLHTSYLRMSTDVPNLNVIFHGFHLNQYRPPIRSFPKVRSQFLPWRWHGMCCNQHFPSYIALMTLVKSPVDVFASKPLSSITWKV